MLDWLKTILAESYTEETDRKISKEIGRLFVARADFNKINAEKKALKEAAVSMEESLRELKAGKDEAECLKEEIAVLRKSIMQISREYEAVIAELKLDIAVDEALAAAGAKNTKAVKALLDTDKLYLGAGELVEGIEEQIEFLKNSPGSSFLFENTIECARGEICRASGAMGYKLHVNNDMQRLWRPVRCARSLRREIN